MSTLLIASFTQAELEKRQQLKPCQVSIGRLGKFHNQMQHSKDTFTNQENFKAVVVASDSVNLQAGKSAHGNSIMRIHVMDEKYLHDYRYAMQDGQACNAHFPIPPASAKMDVYVEDSIQYKA